MTWESFKAMYFPFTWLTAIAFALFLVLSLGSFASHSPLAWRAIERALGWLSRRRWRGPVFLKPLWRAISHALTWFARTSWLGLSLLGPVPLAGERALRWIGRRSWSGPVFVGLFALICGAVPTIAKKTLPPDVHDEMSYLLMADTFLHGRLSNPSPPLWEHFQTFHELMVPTYASKFPVGQGVALAIGTVLGTPRIGAFGAVALACGATCWMLAAVLPRRWAIVGGLLAAIHPTIFNWSQTFWGGGVAMLGAALFCGAALRLARQMRRGRLDPRLRDAILLGVGGATLLNSRPFEGTLLAGFVGGYLLFVAFRNGLIPQLARRAILPAVLVVLPVLAWMLYYDYRITGHATRMPYAEHASQYMVGPIFYWQPGHPDRTNAIWRIQWFHHAFEFDEWNAQRTFKGYFDNVWRKVLFVTRDATAPFTLTTLAFVGGGIALWRRKLARVAFGCAAGLFLVHMMFTPWLRIQYLAVVTPAFILFLTVALRELNAMGRLRRWHFGTAAFIALLIVLPSHNYSLAWELAQYKGPASVRQSVVDELKERGGKHLVCVDYALGPQNLFEWVFNSADIDAQDVIFVHAISMDGLNRMHTQYPDRSMWLLRIEGAQIQVQNIFQSPSMKPATGPATPALQPPPARDRSDFRL